MARWTIFAKNDKIVYQGVEYTVAEWIEMKRSEEWVDRRQEELAQKKRRITFRLILWMMIGMAALPFAAVLMAAFWLQDLVAGTNKHKWRKGNSNADTTDPR